MAPTTIPGQVTQTTPYGRDPELAGYPVRVCEMLSTLTGTAYAHRVAVDTVPHIRETKKAIGKLLKIRKQRKASLSLKFFQLVRPTGDLLPLRLSRDFRMK